MGKFQLAYKERLASEGDRFWVVTKKQLFWRRGVYKASIISYGDKGALSRASAALLVLQGQEDAAPPTKRGKYE